MATYSSVVRAKMKPRLNTRPGALSYGCRSTPDVSCHPERGTWRVSNGRAGDWFESYEPSSSCLRDRFDMTTWLARSSSPLGATTHSFELGNFQLCVKRPRTGGLCRRCCGLWRNQFRRGGDFGRVVSGLEIRLPGNGDRVRQRRDLNEAMITC